MILAIETSDILCSLAFWDKGRSHLEYNLEMPQQHATLVGSLTEQGLKFLAAPKRMKKFTIDDIDLVAVSIGPGSFTGLRIGLSFAQGFCSARQIVIAGISNHQILAAQRIKSIPELYTMIEARRDEVYLAQHEIVSDSYTRISEHKIVAKKELAEVLSRGSQLISSMGMQLDQADLDALQDKGIIRVDSTRFTANYLAALAAQKIEYDGADNLADIEPLYIRPFAGAT